MMRARLLLYSYSGNDFVVDEYVLYCLDNIKLFVSDIVIVVNKKISCEAEKQFQFYSDKIYVNIYENSDSPICAYKAGLESYGWDNLDKFEEIIFMSDEVFGPVYSFDELFNTMANRDVSFWEIVSNRCPTENDVISLTDEFVSIYFIAVRKDMFLHDEYRTFFDSVLEHSADKTRIELIKRFTALGFQYGTYIDDENLEIYVPNIILHAPRMLIEKYRCPVFLRNIFTMDYKNFTIYSDGDEITELLAYLDKNTRYDIEMVYDSVIKSVNQYDFKCYMRNNYILSENKIERCLSNKPKIALMLHLYYDDLFADMLEYAKNMPEYADIFVSTNTEEKKQKLLELAKDFPNKVKIIIMENRGRDVAALAVAFREYVYNYEIICFAHDKKATHADYLIKGKTYEKHCYSNVLVSKEYVLNVINKFLEDEKIGILAPPAPLFAEYYPAVSGYGCGWGINYELCMELAERLNITLKLDRNKAPIAPYGSIFWFRVDALKPLFDLNLQYSDLPAEPVPCDGTISHAIERMHPYIAQSKGYYSAWILSEKNAAAYLSNLHYMLSEVNKEVYRFFPADYFVKELYDIKKLKEKMDNMSNMLENEENAKKLYAAKCQELNDAHNREINLLQKKYDDVINSKSWKITKPLRFAMNFIKNILK